MSKTKGDEGRDHYRLEQWTGTDVTAADVLLRELDSR